MRTIVRVVAVCVALSNALNPSSALAKETSKERRKPDASVVALGSRVADWQLSHLDNFDYVPATAFRKDTEAPRDWIQAAFYIGLSQFAEVANNPSYVNAILAHGKQESWGFDERPRHADADAIGGVWVWAAQRTKDTSKLAPTRARFDAVLAAPSKVSLEFIPKPKGGGEPDCQPRWCWSDALFMAPPVWISLSKATGDARYRMHADAEFWATTDYLYDPQDHLYFRDSRFISQRDGGGRKIFWSRGNGWVFAGLVRILEDLPADHPNRARYETLFKQMAEKIVSVQGAAGYWPVSLLEPQQTPETSGTGFFVYGLMWGVNNGLLPASKYTAPIERGWQALTAAVKNDGKLGWVQRVGAAPDSVTADDTQLYGVGAFLLAASEVAKSGVPRRQ